MNLNLPIWKTSETAPERKMFSPAEYWLEFPFARQLSKFKTDIYSLTINFTYINEYSQWNLESNAEELP